jgi:hypothetical protein
MFPTMSDLPGSLYEVIHGPPQMGWRGIVGRCRMTDSRIPSGNFLIAPCIFMCHQQNAAQTCQRTVINKPSENVTEIKYMFGYVSKKCKLTS